MSACPLTLAVKKSKLQIAKSDKCKGEVNDEKMGVFIYGRRC